MLHVLRHHDVTGAPSRCPRVAAAAPTVGTANPRLADRFLHFVAAADFPCVGAKAALARDAIEVHPFARLGTRGNDAPLLAALTRFGASIDQCDPADTTVRSLVAVFDGPGDTDELRFEALLWAQLRRLHALDVAHGRQWAGDVSADPRDAAFSFSLGGHPFFVIGLHPGASRDARRFEQPAMVFNSHRQFAALRADGRYVKMQAATRERDIALQGSINPNLADFGTASEARQYSGRAVDAGWTCPFQVLEGT
jgi:uncharacterized protein